MSDGGPGAYEGHATLRREAGEAMTQAMHARGSPVNAFIGFDGFVDVICDLVDVRASMRTDDYAPIATMDALARRIAAFAGKSANLEVVTRDVRFGGNGPLLASGLAALGARVTYAGAIGHGTDAPQRVHPAFAPFAASCARALPLCAPGRTDALEFRDGKLMLNHTQAVQDVTWERVVDVLGLDAVRTIVSECDVLGIVNWSLLGGVEGILHGLMRDVLPWLASPAQPPPLHRARRLFVDLSDPAKRTDADVARMLETLRALQQFLAVTLGLNLSEAQRLAAVCGVRSDGEAGDAIALLAGALRERIGLACVVVHPREGAGAATGEEQVWVDGPFTARPRLSTGAGDHFNAGFVMAQCLGLSLQHCAAVATHTSGAYVRDGSSPNASRVADLLRSDPARE